MSLRFENLDKFPAINHFVTTRTSGISSDNFESLNLSFNVGDSSEKVISNRRFISKMLNINYQNLYFPDQCHTNTVKIIPDNGNFDLTETDAIITSAKGIGIGVLAADCIPILFFDPKNLVVGAAHAGWRGTIKKIAFEVVNKMIREFNSHPKDIVAGIGPGISLKNYEVDKSVIDEVEKAIKKPERFFVSSGRNNHYLLNLQDINFQMLIECGLPENNIEVMRNCTFDNKHLFFSARRDGFNTGRFGAVIVLK